MRNEASKCEWRHAPEARGEIWEFWRKLVELRPASGEDGWLSLARRSQASGLCGGCHTCWGEGANEKSRIERMCISPYVEEPLNSKVIKSFVPELRSLYVFFEFRDSYVYLYMLWTFHVYFAYSCIWLWNISTVKFKFLVHLSVDIIIIVIILFFFEFFTPTLADGFSLEFEWL